MTEKREKYLKFSCQIKQSLCCTFHESISNLTHHDRDKSLLCNSSNEQAIRILSEKGKHIIEETFTSYSLQHDLTFLGSAKLRKQQTVFRCSTTDTIPRNVKALCKGNWWKYMSWLLSGTYMTLTRLYANPGPCYRLLYICVCRCVCVCVLVCRCV